LTIPFFTLVTLKMKKSFKIQKEVVPIYSGGKATVSYDGKYILSTVQEEIVVMELESGKVLHNLKGVN
jgi:U3 small nucleolar RNA-associated protein 13